MAQKQARFGTDDIVKMSKPTLYNEMEGIIISVERNYKQLHSHLPADKEAFDPRGLVTRESDIQDIKIPYRFDGEYLEVDYPNGDGFRTERSKFYGYSYTIKTEKMHSIYPEYALTLVKKPNHMLKDFGTRGASSEVIDQCAIEEFKGGDNCTQCGNPIQHNEPHVQCDSCR